VEESLHCDPIKLKSPPRRGKESGLSSRYPPSGRDLRWVLLQNPLFGGVWGGFLKENIMQTKRKIVPYNSELKELAKELRKNMTLSEVLLWNELKQKKMLGYDFDRQRPIGNFIVDFFCKELSLAVEIDGDTHIYKYDYDEERQKELENLSVRFLRFEDIEVKKNMNNVLRVIEDWIVKNKPTPDPSEEGNL
jgi:very-short-patch-repair endonuclease